MTAPLRVLLDVNVWVANLLAAGRGRQGTTVQNIVSMIAAGRWGYDGRDVQLVVSLEMLETLQHVLTRRGASAEGAEAYCDAVRSIMKYGPEELDPYLLLGGHGQFAMDDLEDAGVLATAFASRTALLVTDNLKDFQTKDAGRIDTRVVRTASGRRQLYAMRHRRGEVDLIVAHPLDVMSWIEGRMDFEPGEIWNKLILEAAKRS